MLQRADAYDCTSKSYLPCIVDGGDAASGTEIGVQNFSSEALMFRMNNPEVSVLDRNSPELLVLAVVQVTNLRHTASSAPFIDARSDPKTV